MGACTSVSFAWTRFLSLGWGQGRGKQAAQGSEMNMHINHTAPDVCYVQREFMPGEPMR